MTCRIDIDFRPGEGAVLRLIGLVERRGFVVCAMNLPETRAGAASRLTLHLAPRDAGRRVDSVCAQLSKMYEVVAVNSVEPRALEAAS
ncbi:MAG: ACT domain-containing protein [Oceanicaulis sp.]